MMLLQSDAIFLISFDLGCIAARPGFAQ